MLSDYNREDVKKQYYRAGREARLSDRPFSDGRLLSVHFRHDWLSGWQDTDNMIEDRCITDGCDNQAEHADDYCNACIIRLYNESDNNGIPCTSCDNNAAIGDDYCDSCADGRKCLRLSDGGA